MIYKVGSSYGYSYLEGGARDERGILIETKISGQLCSVGGVIGRLWCIQDSSAHCGGHGVGNVYGSNAVLATSEMTLLVVKRSDEVVILED